MCLALPAEVLRLETDDTAVVEVDGAQLPVSLAFLNGVRPGDFVVVHVGYALSKIDPEEAAEQIALMRAGDQEATVQ
ncbi:MAG: HypC/HybG/HupF family hydrogenase formation chaperone [Pseudomonadota bacterium]